jgi:hypothetical protein
VAPPVELPAPLELAPLELAPLEPLEAAPLPEWLPVVPVAPVVPPAVPLPWLELAPVEPVAPPEVAEPVTPELVSPIPLDPEAPRLRLPEIGQPLKESAPTRAAARTTLGMRPCMRPPCERRD